MTYKAISVTELNKYIKGRSRRALTVIPLNAQIYTSFVLYNPCKAEKKIM